MTDTHALLREWVRNEFAAEQRSGFARLKRVPDTQVIRFLDHFATLNAEQQAALVTVLAEWSAYGLSGTPLPHATYERFARATAFPGRAEGLRYTGVTLLAGLAKGGLAAWFQARGITGQALQPPEGLLPNLAALVPAKTTTLRRLVKTTFAQRFAADATDIGSETWRYRGRLSEAALQVLVRYSSQMGRPQLDYQIQVQAKERSVTTPNLCFESVLGVGFGRWDYLTHENAERSVQLLAELVEYVATLPARLPVGGVV